MSWLDSLYHQNSHVHALAQAAMDQNLYQPNLQDLDQGVARIPYVGHLPQPPEIVGRADGQISPQEYLQGYVHFVRSDPLQNEAAANLLYQHLGLKLPFVLSDFDPNTLGDVDQKQMVLRQIETVKNQIGYSGPKDDAKLKTALLQWLESKASPSSNDKTNLKTVSGWEVFSGVGAACNGLENAYDSGFAYAFGTREEFVHHELFYVEDFEKDGAWLAHGFASTRVNDKPVYLDPARFVNGELRISQSDFPKTVQAVVISDLENLALDLVNHIREDRRLKPPLLSLDDRKQHVDLALLLAPDSIFVILEAIVVYSESLQTQELTPQIQNFKSRAEALYPGSVELYLATLQVE